MNSEMWSLFLSILYSDKWLEENYLKLGNFLNKYTTTLLQVMKFFSSLDINQWGIIRSLMLSK